MRSLYTVEMALLLPLWAGALTGALVSASATEVVVTPEDFGAIGDGKANDWAPIEQALARCSTIVYGNSTARSCRVRFSKSYPARAIKYWVPCSSFGRNN